MRIMKQSATSIDVADCFMLFHSQHSFVRWKPHHQLLCSLRNRQQYVLLSTPKRAKLLMMWLSSNKGMLWMKESKANGSDKIIGNYRSNLRSIPIINFPAKNLSFPSDSSGEVCSLYTHATYAWSASYISLHCWSSCSSRSLYPDHQLPRHDAVPSLSHRPLLFPSRTLATR